MKTQNEVIDYKKRCTELEKTNTALSTSLEETRELLEETVFDESININCQSGGTVYIKTERTNMKVEDILTGLKDYLQSGKNEQALIDFLEA